MRLEVGAPADEVGLVEDDAERGQDRAEAEHREVARPERRPDQRREGGAEVRDHGERGRQDAAHPDVVAAGARHARGKQRHHDQHGDVQDERDQRGRDQVAAGNAASAKKFDKELEPVWMSFDQVGKKLSYIGDRELVARAVELVRRSIHM